MKKSRILFLGATRPAASSPWTKKAGPIAQKIRSSDQRDSLELITRWAVRPDDLLEYLNEYRPSQQIVGISNSVEQVSWQRIGPSGT